jgi:choline dehydrogenase-like flavoprotein
MLVDGRTVAAGTKMQFDLCIVGAGPAGLAVARHLANTGLSIGLVESGGFQQEMRTQRLFAGKNIGHVYWKLDTPRLRYFGGATARWGGWCRPLDEVDFERRSWIPDSGWPISLRDLEPHLAPAHEICELLPPDYSVERWLAPGEEPLPLPAEEFPAAIFQFSPPTRFGERYRQEMVGSPRVTTLLHSNVLEIMPTDSVRAVSHLRVASLGRNEFTISARAYVLATGGIENARVLLASNSRVPAGLGNDHDLVGRYFMEHPHVAMGYYLPTVPSFTGGFYIKHRKGEGEVKGVHIPSERLAREQGLLGISISLEPPGYSIGDFFNTWPRPIVLTLTRIERLIQEQRPRAFAAVRRVERFIRQLHVSDRHHDFSRLVYQFLEQLEQGASQAPLPSAAQLPLYRLYCRSEQTPNRSSRVLLDRRRDALGVPRAILDWRLTAQDTESIEKACRQFALVVGRSGTGRVWLPAPSEAAEWEKRIVGGPHHMGTTKMSATPRTGVVDPNCRVHGLGNLFIAGSSVFPTSGYANPTLTLIALAYRLADHLKVTLS